MHTATVPETRFFKNTTVSVLVTSLMFIFLLKFLYIPLNTGQILILFLLCKLIVFKKDKLILPFDNQFFITLFPLMLFGVYITTTTLLSGGSGISPLLATLILLFQTTTGAYLIVMFSFKKGMTLDQFLYSFFILCSIQGFLTLLNFLLPPYRDILYIILPPGGHIKSDSVVSFFRVRGLFQSTGATISAFLSLGFLTAAYLYASCNLSAKDKKYIIIGLPFILIGVLFTGRTGLLMIPFAILFYYVLLVLYGKLTFKKILPILLSPFVLIIVYLILKQIYLAVTGGGIRLAGGGEILAKWEGWAFGQFIDFYEGKAKSNNTLAQLANFLFIPSDDKTLLFGDVNSWAFIRTDLGYIRMLFASGVIGVFIYYTGFLSLYISLIIRSKFIGQKIFFFFLLLWMLIIEYKEPFFGSFYFTGFIMLVTFINQRENAENAGITVSD